MVNGQKPNRGTLVISMPKPAPPSTTRLRKAPTPIGAGESVNSPDTDLFGRAVALAAQDRQISIWRLEQGLDISLDVAERLINQLVQAGIIERSSSFVEKEIKSETDPAKSFFINDPKYNFRTESDNESLEKKREEELNKAGLQKSLNNDNSQYSEIATSIHIADIDKIDSSYSDTEIEILVSEALRPLLSRANLSDAQKSEIIRASSASFKSCLHSDHGALVGNELIFPDIAPAMWKQDRVSVVDPVTSAERLEDAREFTKRVYGPWLGNGLTRNMLRKLDNPLFQALYRAYGTNLPDDLPLPTKKDENDRWVARVEKEGLASVIPEGASPEFVLKEASRLEAARHRRKQK